MRSPTRDRNLIAGAREWLDLLKARPFGMRASSGPLLRAAVGRLARGVLEQEQRIEHLEDELTDVEDRLGDLMLGAQIMKDGELYQLLPIRLKEVD